jgi:hypothetical protein
MKGQRGQRGRGGSPVAVDVDGKLEKFVKPPRAMTPAIDKALHEEARLIARAQDQRVDDDLLEGAKASLLDTLVDLDLRRIEWKDGLVIERGAQSDRGPLIRVFRN